MYIFIYIYIYIYIYSLRIPLHAVWRAVGSAMVRPQQQAA